MREMCVHCKEKIVCRPRGLCWTCYHVPSVRSLYGGKVHVNFREGSGARINGNVPLPIPTSAVPGSEDKIEVLTMRAELGLALKHPEDAERSLD